MKCRKPSQSLSRRGAMLRARAQERSAPRLPLCLGTVARSCPQSVSAALPQVRGELRILASITDDSMVRDILAHLVEPTAPPGSRPPLPRRREALNVGCGEPRSSASGRDLGRSLAQCWPEAATRRTDARNAADNRIGRFAMTLRKALSTESWDCITPSPRRPIRGPVGLPGQLTRPGRRSPIGLPRPHGGPQNCGRLTWASSPIRYWRSAAVAIGMHMMRARCRSSPKVVTGKVWVSVGDAASPSLRTVRCNGLRPRTRNPRRGLL
jgi:hypothetical protein